MNKVGQKRENMRVVKGYITSYLSPIRRKTLRWAAHNRILAITLVITTSTAILPLVSAAALIPMVTLVYVGEYLESKGITSVLYKVCVQGLLLTVLLSMLFNASIAIATVAHAIHNRYYNVSKRKKLNIMQSQVQRVQMKNPNFALF